MLLRFLKLRLVVNGVHIYPLRRGKSQVITMPTNPSRIVVTNGYHFSAPMQIVYMPQRKLYYSVNCIVENDVLVGAGIGMLLLFFMALSSGFTILFLLSISPIIFLIFLYYFRRGEFIRLRRLQ